MEKPPTAATRASLRTKATVDFDWTHVVQLAVASHALHRTLVGGAGSP